MDATQNNPSIKGSLRQSVNAVNDTLTAFLDSNCARTCFVVTSSTSAKFAVKGYAPANSEQDSRLLIIIFVAAQNTYVGTIYGTATIAGKVFLQSNNSLYTAINNYNEQAMTSEITLNFVNQNPMYGTLGILMFDKNLTITDLIK